MTAAPIVTLWRNYEDRAGQLWQAEEWEHVFKRLESPIPFKGEPEHPGWSAASFADNRRLKANTRQVCAVVFDYDNKITETIDGKKVSRMVDEPVTFDAAVALWGEHFGQVHTSKSHAPGWHRLRVLLPLSRPVSGFEYEALWSRLEAFAGIVDPQTKDPSRFWYLPSRSEHFASRRLTGDPLDVDHWLAKPEPAKYQPPPLAPARMHDPSKVERRAIAYLNRIDGATSGQGGHPQTWRAALALARGFDLSESQTFSLLWSEFNRRCSPPWSEKELRHKAKSARNAKLPAGYLLGDEETETVTAKADRRRIEAELPPEPAVELEREPGDDSADIAAEPAVPKETAAQVLGVRTMREILTAARVQAFSKDPVEFLTTAHWRIDDITGGIRAPDSWLIAGDTSFGKCLGPDDRVRMFDGTVKRARDVVKGDLLMGPDSKPRTVLSTTSGHGPMFRIVPERGEPWTCNWCHVLTVVSTRTGKVTDIALDEFLKKTPTYRDQQKLFHVGVEYPESAPPEVDPWFLGLWYGDGTKSLATVCVTSADVEVSAGLHEVATAWGLHVRVHAMPNNAASMHFLSGTHAEAAGRHGNRLLRAMRRTYGDGASLPESCLRGSRSVRLRFLAGLIDSDGYKMSDRGCEIATKSKAWAEEIRLLVRSLGMQCQIYEKTGVAGYEGNVYYRLYLSGDLSVIPTRIRRKQFALSDGRTEPNRTGFTVESIGDGDYSGWTLDGDGRFLLHDFTVTHNTSWLIAIADENILRRKKRVLIVSTEDSEQRFGGRFMVRRSKVNAKRFRNRCLSRDEMIAVTAVEAKGEPEPAYVDVRQRYVEDLCPLLVQVIDDEGIDLIAFDYLQEFDTKRRYQDERIKFKDIAKQLRAVGRAARRPIPSIILSQLTLGEKTGIPTRANIRECKDVGNAADAIMIGFEPAQDITDKTGAVVVEAETKCIYIDKCKDGERKAKIAMKWNAECACFETVRDPEQEAIDRMATQYDDFATDHQERYP